MLYSEINNIKCYFTIDDDKTFLGSFSEIQDYQRVYYKDIEEDAFAWHLYINLKYNSDNLSQFLLTRKTNIYLTYTATEEKTGETKTFWYKISDANVTRFSEVESGDFAYSFKAIECDLINENLLPNEVKSRL